MGAAIIIGLIIAGAALMGAAPAGAAPKGQEPPSVFPAGAKTLSDRWWGPFRFVVFELGDDFGWVVETSTFARDALGIPIEATVEQGFDSADLAQASAITFMQNKGVDFTDMADMLVHEVAERTDDAGLHIYWTVQRGNGPAMVVHYFVPEGSGLGEWKAYTRTGWGAEMERFEGQASSAGEAIEAAVVQIQALTTEKMG